MSDLAPAEQARAARWAARWLDQAYTDRGHEIAADHLRDCADVIERSETMESLREQVDAEHAAWLSAENAVHEANETVESLRAERDDLRAGVAEAQDWANRMTADRDQFIAELARLRATRTAAEDVWGCMCRKCRHAAPLAAAEHWLGGDHSNQTPYPVVRE